MKEKKKKKKDEIKTQPAEEITLSPGKKRIFWLITISIPFLFLIVLELCLRIFNYGGNLDLFIAGPEGYEEYIRCNPEVARRYFDTQLNVPTPPKQLFQKVKPKNCYRIFVLGESSAAGFPYGSNGSFPNILERALTKTFPEKKIEVINVSMAAINSYTLLDFMDEIIEQSPDAVLIYTGHNEYYGALGVGSVQSLGNSRWFIRTYLKMESFKTFLLLRNIIGWCKVQISNLFYKGSEIDPSATLMERVVAEQTIPLGSALYEAGKEQFKLNMEAILQKAADKNIKVIIGELVSNIHDQPPFISVKDKEGSSANSAYSAAVELEKKGDFENANKMFFKAKDMDALRFRASEDFNDLIHELAEKYSTMVVPTKNYFEKSSPNGMIGNNLMLEHLHPNYDGYYLLAKAFYESIRNKKLISTDWNTDGISRVYKEGFTSLDSVYSVLAVKQLKSGWPFKPKSVPNRFVYNFIPSNKIEEVAFKVLKGNSYSIEGGHMELGEYYESIGQMDKAFQEYNSLITSIPHEMEFYQKAVTVLLKQKEYEKASQLLFTSLKYKENLFAYKWIGQIALMNDDFQNAITYLSKGDMNDPQVIFNLGRAFYSDNQWNKGEEFYNRLQNIDPTSQYLGYLKKMRALIQMKSNSQSSFQK